MQKAVLPTLTPPRRAFDKGTAAGRWHAVAFDDAPDWLRGYILDNADVRVQRRARDGAWARGGEPVDMDGHATDRQDSRATWRHEFGHIVDVRLGGGRSYRSAQRDFVEAAEADAKAWLERARSPKRRADDTEAYAAAERAIVDAQADQREGVLQGMATAAGLDFDAFRAIVRDSTPVLDADQGRLGVAAAARMARMLKALELNDPESFLSFASFKDRLDEARAMGASPAELRELQVLVGTAWRRDGSLAKLSDLVGATTRNLVAGFESGFPGHTTRYYARQGAAGTEAFANLMVMAGHPNAAWWAITRLLAPKMAGLFEQIIRGGRP